MVNIKKIVTLGKDLAPVVFDSTEDFKRWQLSLSDALIWRAQMQNYWSSISTSERKLEQRFNLAPGALKGIFLIFVSEQEVLRRLEAPGTLELLTKPDNVVIVQIRRNVPVVITTIHSRNDSVTMKVSYSATQRNPTTWSNIPIGRNLRR
jgi:hypothetical protein